MCVPESGFLFPEMFVKAVVHIFTGILNQITLRALIFAGIIFREFSRKLMPRENFQTLWSHEILGFLPKSPRKMKEIR